MNYKDSLQAIREMNVAGGAGGMFGAGGAGTFGGAVGNVDSYAPGDARVPKILGLGDTRAPGKKGKKGKKTKVPMYRRAFIEALTTESIETPIQLKCLIYTDSLEYQQVITDLCENYNIAYESEPECVILEGTDDYLQNILTKIQGVVTVEPFENGEIVALVGEMDEVSANKIPGGKAQRKTIEDYYHKYDKKGYYDIENFKEEFFKKLDQGIKIEMEHTTDKDFAREIATDHLWEDLEYYTKLAKIENKG
jgi:hypothetical protein